MSLRLKYFSLRFAAVMISSLLSTVAARADKWMTPTAEELSMTSQPEVPGAKAVYLFREETTEDSLHVRAVYTRLKVLTEGGKDLGNVELKYVAGGQGVQLGEITGRTIHADGTVVPFTGKPFEKLIVKGKDMKYMAKVFSMPAVEVGSILEYRYTVRYEDNFYISPDWYVQSDLYTRKAHYLWKPTSKQLITNDGRGQLTSNVAWTPILPKGAELKQTQLPAMGASDPQTVLELWVHDIEPSPEEEYMPPLGSFSYRVLFYYTPYRTREEFWANEGKYWAKKQDKFIGPGAGVASAVKELTAGATTQEAKLRKIYAALQGFENTDFTRTHSETEDKAAGLGEIHTTDDVLARKRGSGDQLAELL